MAHDSVERLIELANDYQAGVVRVSPASVGRGQLVNGRGKSVLLWRTAALGRAGWVREGDESLLDAVASIHGRRNTAPDAVGVVDLTGSEPANLPRA